MIEIIDKLLNVIEKGLKVIIIFCIFSGICVFTPDSMLIKYFNIQLLPSIRLISLLIFIFTISAIIVNVIYNPIEHIYKCYRQNKEKKRQAKEQALERVKEMFSPLEIGKKIGMLYDWFHSHEDAPKEYKRQLQLPIEEQTEKFKTTHTTRSEVSNYFDQSLKYHKKWYVSKKQLKEFIAISHVRALFEVIEPLEIQIGKKYHREVFKFFGKLYRKELTENFT